MSIDTPSVPAPSNDLPVAEPIGPLTAAVTRDEGFEGDFATGERTEPVTLVEETPGTFGDTEK